MFTGIVEATGQVKTIAKQGTNSLITIACPLVPQLKVDQSISHNGVCLTVTNLIPPHQYQVVAVQETLAKSNLGEMEPGSLVNLERSMVLGGRLDGHLVQGHVDTTGICRAMEDKHGSWVCKIEFPSGDHHLVVEKGSICVNGVSLTCFNSTNASFEVALIPYTYQHTNFSRLQPGDRVNLEFDIVGKYIRRILEGRN